MRGQDNLEKHVGQILTNGLVQSFHLNGKVVSVINVTFLKFDKDWLRIVCTDEQTNISIETDDLDNLKSYGDKEFYYPLTPIEDIFPDFMKYKNRKLKGFKELVLGKTDSFSFGVNLYFDNDLNFIIRNHDYPTDENEYLFENKIPTELREK
jgi:hypothetical protein